MPSGPAGIKRGNRLVISGRTRHALAMDLYRPNVALLLRDSSGRLLVCERSDWPGSWQFPQGGIANGESPLEALWREAREEIGLLPRQYRVRSSRGPYRYLFHGSKIKDGCNGQEQTYFLADLAVPAFNPAFGPDPEFQAARWLTPSEIPMDCVPSMKREVYARVLADFFGTER